MLKYRLIFGTLMTIVFTALMLLDGWLDGSISNSIPDKAVQGTILCALLALLIFLAQIELAKLAAANNLKILTPVTIPAAFLLASVWYWPQLFQMSPSVFILVVLAFSLFALLLYQYFRFGIPSLIANCGASCFSIIYLGALASFVMGIRIDFGLWPMLMFVFVVKTADIGAYTFGRLFGKHLFSPVISPKKTWEGMFGAVFFASAVSLFFSCIFSIMNWLWAIVFGVAFAFLGQLGDLAESLIKRDARLKDSGSKVPGFGGLLDVLDSTLASAVFAYLFFYFLQ